MSCSIIHPAATSFSVDRNVFLSTQFSNTLSLCSSLNVTDRVSHPYKTEGNITLLNTDTMTTKRAAQLSGSDSAPMRLKLCEMFHTDSQTQSPMTNFNLPKFLNKIFMTKIKLFCEIPWTLPVLNSIEETPCRESCFVRYLEQTTPVLNATQETPCIEIFQNHFRQQSLKRPSANQTSPRQLRFEPKKNSAPMRHTSGVRTGFAVVLVWPFNAWIKTLRATLSAEIFYWGF
jgi:hypothetical protein